MLIKLLVLPTNPPVIEFDISNTLTCSGFPTGGGGSGPPIQHHRGGGSFPPCWQRKEKNIPYFAVISVKIGHIKQCKTQDFFSPGHPDTLTPFAPPHSNIPGGNPELLKLCLATV